MNAMQALADKSTPRRRLARVCIVLAGLIGAQAFLYGPSLVGRKILLPLDLLSDASVYLPPTPEYAGVKPYDFALLDEVLLFEFERRFATAEIRAGRLPSWSPYIYIGAPYAVWDKYSPFNALYYLFPTPMTLAWMQLLKSIVAGAGAYVFFRTVLGVTFWPAALGAWCYPLTGFFTLWQGYPQSSATAWLPWLLLATDSVVRRPLGHGGPALAALSGLVIVTRIDIGCQALMAAGLFALWRLWHAYGSRGSWRGVAAGGIAAACAVALGLLLSGPYVLPLAEYTRFSDRMLRRDAGQEERPPGGLAEMPRLVLPTFYGSTEHGAILLRRGNLLESGAAAYTGLVATLFLAPLAWCSSRHRSLNVFWGLLSVIALAWTLDLPVLVALLRSPGLKLLSHNRFVFAASFAFLALAVVGLDMIWKGAVERRAWFALPVFAILILGVWCCDRARSGPELPLIRFAGDPRSAQSFSGPVAAAVEEARARCVRSQVYGAALCGLALSGWGLVWLGGRPRSWCGPVAGALLLAELLVFAYGRNPQCDRRLYYPRLPVLERLAEAPPGRVLGVGCLPPNLAMSHGLRDIRGYDSIDPRPLLELLDLTRDPRVRPMLYARTQNYVPQAHIVDGKIELPPLLNMLAVRYLIFRGTPPPHVTPLFVAPDYWALENSAALPRAFIPRRVQHVPPGGDSLKLLAAPKFNPRETAYVGERVALPDDCRGSAQVVDVTPTHTTVHVDAETPSLVVLSDLYYDGWHAYLDGVSVPILRTNHALRGVVAPAGRSTIEFHYQPMSLVWGMRMLLAGLAGMAAWAAVGAWLVRRSSYRTRNNSPITASVNPST
ncbi:MAG TPA: hypothetical protein VGY58_23240 [Gemmataceae bacterium]|nr:hypothetical protein [Gemmataceae bacterium]